VAVGVRVVDLLGCVGRLWVRWKKKSVDSLPVLFISDDVLLLRERDLAMQVAGRAYVIRVPFVAFGKCCFGLESEPRIESGLPMLTQSKH